MNRENLNPNAPAGDLPRRITGLLIPGPPGVADQALWTLVLSRSGETAPAAGTKPRLGRLRACMRAALAWLRKCGAASQAGSGGPAGRLTSPRSLAAAGGPGGEGEEVR